MLAVAALIVAALATHTPVAQAKQPPNFVHILTDDQTIDSLRHMPKTMRRLGKRGTRFSNYHVVQPLCCPARASFLSGQYPHNHGVIGNSGEFAYEAFDFSRTLYTALDDAGYRTGWIGKVMNGAPPDQLEPEPGFDEWFATLPNSQIDMFDFSVSDNGIRRDYSGRFQTDVFAERAARFIESSRSSPFLLTLAVTNPHWSLCEDPDKKRCPPDPAPEDVGSFDGAKFPLAKAHSFSPKKRREANRWWQAELESMQSIDRLVGSLVSRLRRAGELDNTYIIFQSDNGMLHGEHGQFEKNLPWDRSVRVPMLIRGPGFKAGKVRRDLTANVDVTSTILDAAGVAPPVPQDGRSLLGDERRRHLLLEKLLPSNRPGFEAWIQLKNARGWTYWRQADGNGKRHLYHLPSDPHQLNNLYRKKPKLARRMEARLASVRDCAAPCP